ncbi:DNA recombination protein RmuC [Weeksellaceae bacterium TAE3-ERU29]|nr:DNA recombination protein RmuC [Weeksellaceae bacterium TAE3-ERU29]
MPSIISLSLVQFIFILSILFILLLLLFYFYLKLNNNKVSLKKYENQIFELNESLNSTKKQNEHFNLKIIQSQSDKINIEKQLELLNNSYNNLNSELKNERIKAEELSLLNKELNIKNDYLRSKLKNKSSEWENLNARFKEEFKNLAQKILEEKSEKFTQQNQQNLNTLLAPLQQKISVFESKVEQTNKESIERNAALKQQILGLSELNKQMSEETKNLTRALKGENKTQGNWGEMILESVLEKSGLQKGLQYHVQQSFTTDSGKRLIPDVIIDLPENKKMIIDAKVSLVAYEKYINEPDERQKEFYLKKHLESIQIHIQKLSDKNYGHIHHENSPDFILLFIPIEAAFAAASHIKPDLYASAFDKNIILVSPTTLLAVLKTIDSIWQNEKQKRNVQEIAKEAGRLYDKFALLIDEMQKVGSQLTTTQNTYNSAMKKLTGNRNLIKNIENLKKLGAKTSKNLMIENSFFDDDESE